MKVGGCMYPIYILEDDTIQQNRLRQSINRYAQSRGIGEYQCKVFDDAQELMKEFEESGGKAIFFLDLEIRGSKRKGVEIAKAIYFKSPYSPIIFVSTYSEFMPYTYKSMVRALDFIIKEVDEKEFETRVARCLDYASESEKRADDKEFFHFRNDEGADIFLRFDEIFFVETNTEFSHKLILHSTHSNIEFRGVLTDLLKKESRFFKCHRSYIVNPRNVTVLNKVEKMLYFRGGQSCPISRRRINSLISLIEGEK